MVDKAGQRLPFFDEVAITITEGTTPDPRPFLNGKSDVYEIVRPHDYEQFKENPGMAASVWWSWGSLVNAILSGLTKTQALIRMAAR